MDYDSHLILHHLDDPLRILYWTIDEAVTLILPAFLGLSIERPFWGLVMTAVCYSGLKHLKKKWGLSTLRHALYWYLPKNNQKLRHTPPSYIREYIG